MVLSGEDGGGDDVNIRPLVRTLAKGAGVAVGGVLSVTMVSSAAIAFFTHHKKDKFGSPSSSAMKNKNASPCSVCKEKGFYMCKLCEGGSTIEWSPLYDPVFINKCLCPTCDGHRVQRCLNCLGSGFVSTS
ncbi:heat shock protein DnaJ, cysteine-rich domain-containing protein [Artemisia annua]|uniref:Heat shock protein DnaJ, cysteine-rich domain-containing protein n=1 Tax=Artemisia annua TaxID=35608 RepID=A0A2U1L303_ARTAN|nr:heat shock protein DnaJ, cysteine-rich domain-containing protein [Artemisia annua]